MLCACVVRVFVCACVVRVFVCAPRAVVPEEMHADECGVRHMLTCAWICRETLVMAGVLPAEAAQADMLRIRAQSDVSEMVPFGLGRDQLQPHWNMAKAGEQWHVDSAPAAGSASKGGDARGQPLVEQADGVAGDDSYVSDTFESVASDVLEYQPGEAPHLDGEDARMHAEVWMRCCIALLSMAYIRRQLGSVVCSLARLSILGTRHTDVYARWREQAAAARACSCTCGVPVLCRRFRVKPHL